ncbi:ornithine carbamoyltransferase [Reinekea blandensis]|uniref:Probable ornithine carbamoyltransferase protein n=1 Tax=Reinekea blandensis MED297 TaxID=314283 RepID=A4B9K0_9GAMM|nr:ornithine carbamoyltransferase [Reinekea blandensis]EAR11301.1 probable ornithine carbamoyltransferase protein [Reinekea sp. MED297] [Reinekea blandensis MED297]
MKSLIDITDLTRQEILNIWARADQQPAPFANNTVNVAWSFEGNGIRTRTTFVQSFQSLDASYVELPNLLKTQESVIDLAGYLDPFYDLYVIRDRQHDRLQAFAEASTRPVINAMSSLAHPCEVLTDAAYLAHRFGNLENLRILLVGPLTNVFRSWHALAAVFGCTVTHACPKDYQDSHSAVRYLESITGTYDVVITDAWPEAFNDRAYQLTPQRLADLGNPVLLPTPPVSVGRELAEPLSGYPTFAGYQQKAWLLPVQRAIISQMIEAAPSA